MLDILDILVVDDDVLCVRAIRRMLPNDCRVEATASKDGALGLLRDPQRVWHLVLIDVRLGRERTAGLEVLDVVAAERPRLPRALVTASTDRSVMNRAVARRAFLVRKPFGRCELAGLVNAARPRPADALLASALAQRCKTWRLSPAQREIVRLLLQECKPAQICRELDICESTYRTHVRELLLRAEMTGVDSVVGRLLRDAIAAALDHDLL